MTSLVEPSIRGLIFDCDGTLVDSMPLHLIAWQKSFARYNALMSVDEFYAHAGIPTRRIVELHNDKYQTQIPVEEASVYKEELYVELIPHLKPIDQVVIVARHFHGTLPMAVASGGELFVVKKSLDAVGITDLFDHIVTASDVPRGKPFPDLFLETARRLGVHPSHCLVFEDADNGTKAASAADMAWVDVRPHLLNGARPV